MKSKEELKTMFSQHLLNWAIIIKIIPVFRKEDMKIMAVLS